MNKETIAALHEGMAAVQSGKVAPGRVWIVKRRPDGTVERRQVDPETYQMERAVNTAATGSVLPARSRLGVSQDRFAELLGLSAATVRNWEQGRRKPTGALLKLLDIAERHPEIFLNKPATSTGPHRVRLAGDELAPAAHQPLASNRVPTAKAKGRAPASKAMAAPMRARCARLEAKAKRS